MIKNNVLNKLLIINVLYIFIFSKSNYFPTKRFNYEFMFNKAYYITSWFDVFPFYSNWNIAIGNDK